MKGRPQFPILFWEETLKTNGKTLKWFSGKEENWKDLWFLEINGHIDKWVKIDQLKQG
jgi:hypothetical protein